MDDHGPDQEGVNEGHGGHGGTGLEDFFGTVCTVIVADDRGGAFGDGVDRGLNHLTYAGDNGHDRDIEVTASDGQYVVAADGYNTVGQLHDKAGGAEADDVCGFFTTGRQFPACQQTDFVFCLVL